MSACCTCISQYLSYVHCLICFDIIRQQVELVTCERISYAQCMCRWIDQHSEPACPCCYADHLKDFSTIKKAPSLVVTSINSLCAVCANCHQPGRARSITYSVPKDQH